jgi:hypothetical protein
VRAPRSIVASFLTADLCLATACGGVDEAGEGGAVLTTERNGRMSITVALAPEHDSGARGTAVLRGDQHGFVVTLAVTPDDRSYAAHINDVSCSGYRRIGDFDAELDTIVVTLADLRQGRSRSTVREPLLKYARRGYSINIHQYEWPFPVVACGDLAVG